MHRLVSSLNFGGKQPAAPDSSDVMVKKSTSVAKATRQATSAAPRAAARKNADGGAFDRRTLGAIRDRLVAQRGELLEQLREIEEAASNSPQPDVSGEVSFDEDSVDAGSFTIEREKDLSIAHNVRDLLGKMAKALDKIEEGTYGICESCGQPINAARVKALPHVLLCLSCKKAEERR
jgi:DnaK suppressor protein